ncbi:MAG: alanine:cation symporter family protein, partial [Eubacteriales bacterium]|nr:alanine:cation symporter family protein [Eubacteriales bacterium]
FIDTFVVLTITALTVIITLYTKGGILADGTIPEAINKTNLAQTAFGSFFGETGGNMFIAVALFFFAFSTVLGWNMFGKINVQYLFGKNPKTEKIATYVYTAISLIFIFLGTLASNDLVWELSDMFNQLMVIPNVIGLVACTGLVVSATHFGKKDELKVVE